jgi:hypothetical protein
MFTRRIIRIPSQINFRKSSILQKRKGENMDKSELTRQINRAYGHHSTPRGKVINKNGELLAYSVFLDELLEAYITANAAKAGKSPK